MRPIPAQASLRRTMMSVLVVCAATVATGPAAHAYTDIYIFGDSLSDTGNVDRFPANLFVDIGPTGSFSEGIV